jgi:hypothetical protein
VGLVGAALWAVVQAYIDEQTYPPSVAAVADKAGLTGRSTLTHWKKAKGLPDVEHLRAVAHTIEQPYRVLLDAALVDAGYLERDEAQPRRVLRLTRPELAAARRDKRPPKADT